jgi:hypothetical protein
LAYVALLRSPIAWAKVDRGGVDFEHTVEDADVVIFTGVVAAGVSRCW